MIFVELIKTLITFCHYRDQVLNHNVLSLSEFLHRMRVKEHRQELIGRNNHNHSFDGCHRQVSAYAQPFQDKCRLLICGQFSWGRQNQESSYVSLHNTAGQTDKPFILSDSQQRLKSSTSILIHQVACGPDLDHHDIGV